jgi:6-phosphogluconate dehydrogenase
VIDELLPHLEPDDIVIDGGNSLFTDTDRRFTSLKERKVRFIGMGVSGGEEGALEGPSMMPGGEKDAYARIEPMVIKMAAQVDGTPCCTYIGIGGAGHYVKMVHNGIEYADMQLIAEALRPIQDHLWARRHRDRQDLRAMDPATLIPT